MCEKILILGGTKEAAALAHFLTSQGHNVISSLAGRTREPLPLQGETRTGGFGGVDAMAAWIKGNKIDRVIDATHPFALRISKNAKEACRKANVPLEVKTRKPWACQKGDHWIEVETPEEAASKIPDDARVLLALGSQYLSAFERCADPFFLVRMVDKHPVALQNHTLLLGRPSKDWREEAKLLKNHKITHIVCRNSGGKGAYAKIEAARHLAITVIMIKMPG